MCSWPLWGIFAPQQQKPKRSGPGAGTLWSLGISLGSWLLNLITFWNLPISRFLKPLDRGLCCLVYRNGGGVFFFFLTEHHVLSNETPYSAAFGSAVTFISPTESQRKSNIKFDRKTALRSFAYAYKKSNQSAKPQQIRKYIQLFKFSKENL